MCVFMYTDWTVSKLILTTLCIGSHVLFIRQVAIIFICFAVATSVTCCFILSPTQSSFLFNIVLPSGFAVLCYMLRTELFLQSQPMPHFEHSSLFHSYKRMYS